MLISDMIGQMGTSFQGGNKKLSSVSRNAETIKDSSTGMSSLKPGQVFEGTVSEIKGDKVTLALSDGTSVSARIEGDVPMKEGQSVFFEVKSNDGGTVKISPMTNGDYSNPILNSALKGANLPVNDQTLSLVKEMMNNGLPINDKNLNRMGKLLLANPGTDVSTLVKMDKMGLKIDAENITNFTRLEENTNALLKESESIVDSIPKMFEEASLSTEEMIGFEKALLMSLSDSSENEDGQITVNGQTVSEGQVENAGQETLNADALAGKDVAATQNQETIPEGTVTEKGQTALLNGENSASAINQAGTDIDTANQKITAEESQNPAQNAQENKASENIPGKMPLTNEAEAAIVRPEKAASLAPAGKVSPAMEELSKELDKVPGLKEKNPLIFDEKGNIKPDVSEKQLLNTVINHFEDNPELAKKYGKSIFSGKEYNKVLSDALKNDWIIKPDKVSDKEAVKELFKNLERQLDNIDKIAKSLAGKDNPVSNAVNSSKSNVDFMNQLNQLYSYVQIPLKMMNQNATGDLYVYTDRRKKGGQSSDTLSAFLHLSLDNLGNTDVSVKMNKKNVDIKFFFDNEASYRLVSDNKELLFDKLKIKGYLPNIDVTKDDEPKDFVEKFLEAENIMPKVGDIKRFTFDVKA